MCFRCFPGSDHDRPYQYGNRLAAAMRLTLQERQTLTKLRRHVLDVKHGYKHGRAYGDIAPDSPKPSIGQEGDA